MKILNQFFILTYFTCSICSGSAQDLISPAKLDKRDQISPGKTVTIRSQFRGLPLVEPCISAHPADNDHLLAAAMVVTDVTRPYESCRLSSFISRDGGLNWQETAHDWWGYDPWTAILPDGQTVMSWIGTPRSFQHQFPIRFFFSPDGGAHWEEEVQTLSNPHGHDGTKVIAGNEAFYFTTVRFSEDMGADVALYRKGEGKMFEQLAVIPGNGKRLNFCEPAVLTDGTVLVPASHFLKEFWVQNYDHRTGTLSPPVSVSTHPGGARGYMRMVADRSSGSRYQDRVYFIRAAGKRGDTKGVLLNYSADAGKSWSTDIRVDLFPEPGDSKAMVTSAVVNKDGILGISWMDAQDDPEQKKYDLYFTISRDGGKSFQRPVRITERSTDPRTEGNGDVANKFPGGGHYLGLDARADGSFQLIWSDSRSGIFELQTCNVAIN